MAEIKNDAGRHVAVCMCVFVVILCVARCVMSLLHTAYGLSAGMPLITAFLFAAVETIVIVMLWLRTASAHIDRLPVFHAASSGFRVLAAIAVLFVVYIIVGRGKMLPYVVWMVVYYFAVLILHSAFFSRENGKLFDKPGKEGV